MKDYVLVSDSTADLPVELVKEYNVTIIPFPYSIEDETYFYKLDGSDDIEEFYDKIRKGTMPVTSQINPEAYKEAFEKIIESGKDILYLGFTSGMSGTFQSSQIAISMVEGKYPDAKILSVDSLAASVGQGIFVYLAAKKKAEGLNIDELYDWIVSRVNHVRHWFMVDDLFHLKRGGRVNTVEAMVGTALKIKVILSVDDKGKLIVKSKARGEGKALDYLIGRFDEECPAKEDAVVVVGHASAPEKANKLKAALLERGVKEENIFIAAIGPIIGTHVGPGMAAVTFFDTE